MAVIETVKGNLLENVKTGIIVHGCNDLGRMGAGFALALKNMYPNVYKVYHNEYTARGLVMGDAIPAVADATSENGGNLVVFNAITQHLYAGHPDAEPGQKRFVSYDAVEKSFSIINDFLDKIGTETDDTLHFPLIGAGLGGGNWEIISTIIDQTIKHPTKLWVL